MPSDEAVELNFKAIECERRGFGDPKGQKRGETLLNQCIVKYPNFEIAFITKAWFDGEKHDLSVDDFRHALRSILTTSTPCEG